MQTPKYISQDGYLVEVSHDVYASINQQTNAIRYRARLRKECIATRREASRCEGDCCTCNYHVSHTASVEAMDEQLNTQIADYRNCNTEMLYRCEEILADMARVDPDGEYIGRMLMDGYEVKDIAAKLGIAVSTCYARIRRIRRHLKEG